jgi:hypothetical protein
MTRTSLSALSYRARLQRRAAGVSLVGGGRDSRCSGGSAHAVGGRTPLSSRRLSTLGAYERYVLRVPNEKAVATTRVELRFPAGVRVTSFADVPGWQLEVVTDSAKAITAAIWTGTLPPQRFIEFPFVAVNPKTDARLEWPGISDVCRWPTRRVDRAGGVEVTGLRNDGRCGSRCTGWRRTGRWWPYAMASVGRTRDLPRQPGPRHAEAGRSSGVAPDFAA